MKAHRSRDRLNDAHRSRERNSFRVFRVFRGCDGPCAEAPENIAIRKVNGLRDKKRGTPFATRGDLQIPVAFRDPDGINRDRDENLPCSIREDVFD